MITTRQIEKLQGELRGKLKALSNETIPTGSLVSERSNDPTDEAQAEVLVAVMIRNINADWHTRRAIEAALERIELGEYGICDACGEPIGINRLHVIPWATLCVPCQSNQEGIGHPAFLHQDVA